MFRKNKEKNVSNEDIKIYEEALNLYQKVSENPLSVCVDITKYQEDRVIFVVMYILLLYKEKLITDEELLTIGIDRKELETLQAIVNSTFNYDTTLLELKVQEAIRVYQKQISELIEEERLSLSESESNEFTGKLAKFAHENDVNNLKIAYRLLKAEGKLDTKGLIL